MAQALAIIYVTKQTDSNSTNTVEITDDMLAAGEARYSELNGEVSSAYLVSQVFLEMLEAADQGWSFRKRGHIRFVRSGDELLDLSNYSA